MSAAGQAKTRIEQLKKIAPAYTELYKELYTSPKDIRRERMSELDLQFELLSDEIDGWLNCDDCGSGCIEDARYMAKDKNSKHYCDQCGEFARLWDATPEMICYTWPI